MNANHELNQLLGDLAARPTPPLPTNFQHEVWRHIHRQQSTAKNQPTMGLLDWLLSSIFRPQPLAATLLLALIFGALSGFIGAPKPAIQLNAFSVNAPGMQLPLSIK